MQPLSAFFEDNKPLAFVIIFATLLALIFVLLFLYRRLFSGRLKTAAGGRTRQPRLGIVDAFDLDRQRQLVIVRRDNVEHLIMIGGPNDVLLEGSIVRAQSVGSIAGARDKESLGGIVAPALPVAPGGPISPSVAPPLATSPTPAPVPPGDLPSAPPPLSPPPPRPASSATRPVPPPARAEGAVETAAPRSEGEPDGNRLPPPPARPAPAARPSTLPPRPAPSPRPPTPLRTPLPPRPSLSSTLPPRPVRPAGTTSSRPEGTPATTVGRETVAVPDPAAPTPEAAPPARSNGDAPVVQPPAAAAPAPSASQPAAKSLQSLESLEEEMAKLLGRPAPPRREG